MKFTVLDKPQHQGKYHLLAILLIPALLVSIFLSTNWWVPAIIGVISLVITYLAFKR